MSSGNMRKDAWLHALRSDPSPLFKEQLRARLRAHEPAPLDSARLSTPLKATLSLSKGRRVGAA
jgi:hypothetical protein